MSRLDWRVLVLGAACACGSDDGEGTIEITAYGEEFVEEGLPASAVGDGWEIDFERFIVRLAEVRVAGQAVTPAADVDLAVSSMGAGHALGSVSAPVGTYTGASFVIERLDVAGSATKGSEQKSFELSFEDATAYTRCEARTSVSAGGVSTFQITIHADHLFYDSLVSEQPQLLFQPLADADTDADGSIEATELAATDIGAYDPGSDGGIGDLLAWLGAAARTVGHVDGEGHCEAAAVSGGG